MFTPFAFIQGGAAATVGYGTPTVDSGCVVYWDFGDSVSWGGSGTTVTDVKGNSDGTINGANWSYTSSVKGAAYVSTKSGLSYINPSSGYFSSNPFNGTTFEMVWRPVTTLAADNVIYRWVAGVGYNDSRFESNIQQYGGSPVPNRIFADAVSEEGSNATDLLYLVTPTANSWVHFVHTMEQGSNFIMYYNNSAVATSTNTFGASDTFLWDAGGAIFGSDDYPAGHIIGELALFRMYNRALSSAEVTSNYNFYNTYFSF